MAPDLGTGSQLEELSLSNSISEHLLLLLLVCRKGVILCSLNGIFCVENVLNFTQP